jgi:hypothetical protein
MGLIAEKCPRCRRVTRCLVSERQGFFGGLVLGIPFFVPLSSVRCVCGECGHEFDSPSAAENRAVPPEVAAGLDTDALLGLTNPELRKAQTLSGLRADPQLPDAFLLLDRLAPGYLFWQVRDRRWVRNVLLPEADKAGVEPKWLLAVLEGSAASRGTWDDVGELRGLVPALRAELAAKGRGREGGLAGFKLPHGGHRPGG